MRIKLLGEGDGSSPIFVELNLNIMQYDNHQTIENIYILVSWDIASKLKDHDWFEKESVKDQRATGHYFIPLLRWHEYLDSESPAECLNCENYSTEDNFCNHYNETKPVDYCCEHFKQDSPL